MTVRVVVNGPPMPAGRRVGRAIAATLGALLLVLAVLGITGVSLITPFLFLGDAGWSDEERPEAIKVAAGCLLAAVVCLPLALRLLRGRRRLVLFLRRFGFDDATQTVSFAAANVIGRSWRLVTLDDDRIEAVGGSRAPRRLLGWTVTLTLAAVSVALWWFLSGGPDGAFDLVLANTDSSGSGSIGDELGRIIGAAIITALLLVLVTVAAAVVGVSSLVSLISYGRARSSERAKTARVRSGRDLAAVSGRIAQRSQRIFAPRLVVVRVADAVWQDAVRDFADRSAAVIIDVSVPSENLLWEIRTLLPVLGHRCVLVGRRDLLTNTAPGGRTVFASSVGREIDGRDVLAYGTTRREIRRFSQALDGHLARL